MNAFDCPFPIHFFHTTIKRRVEYMEIKACFWLVSLFTYCEPNIVYRTFAIPIWKPFYYDQKHEIMNRFPNDGLFYDLEFASWKKCKLRICFRSKLPFYSSWFLGARGEWRRFRSFPAHCRQRSEKLFAWNLCLWMAFQLFFCLNFSSSSWIGFRSIIERQI